MPELPEVETIAAGLRNRILNRKITSVDVIGHSVFRGKSVDFSRYVKNQKVRDVLRRGKYLLFAFSNEKHYLLVHLGMTGQFLWNSAKEKPLSHTHFLFHFQGESHVLHYRDIRRFGWMEIVHNDHHIFSVPDAWDSSIDQLTQSIGGKTGMVKHTLMRQDVMAGLGNIYVDESLHRSQIHPRSRIENLSKSKKRRLCESIKDVLGESLRLGGTSVHTYRDVLGQRGGFKDRLKVYGKNGTPCSCGSKILKKTIAGRGTHYCPKCQEYK